VSGVIEIKKTNFINDIQLVRECLFISIHKNGKMQKQSGFFKEIFFDIRGKQAT